MRRIIIYTAALFATSGCFAPATFKVQVSPLGEEHKGSEEQYIYALPMTVLRVEVEYQELKRIPGPYWEYAEKYLGITDVIRQKSSLWSIERAWITQHTEVDPQHFYSINVLDGDFSAASIQPYFEKGILVDGTINVQQEVRGPGFLTQRIENNSPYVDLGLTANFEERTETMYKTLVTDTSFVKVPVQRTVVEQKSITRKAEEAADFLLEIRTRRFEMLTGEYEVYPDGEAMEAAINKLDQLEASYLSLFIGKTISSKGTRSYFIVPESGSRPSEYQLAMFSEQLGFVPTGLLEGAALAIEIEPFGKIRIPESYFMAKSPTRKENSLVYRIPDVVELRLMLGRELISKQRLTLFQSGALVSSPIK